MILEPTNGMSGLKKGEQCGAFFEKAGMEASLANAGARKERTGSMRLEGSVQVRSAPIIPFKETINPNKMILEPTK